MTAQTDYVFSRVDKWVFNHARHAAPFYIVIMVETLLMLAFAEPLAADIAAVTGLVIVGWRDIDALARGSPEALFFRAFDEDSLESTCKYYARTMAAKGVPEAVYEIDNSMLRHFYYNKNLTWTYYMVVMMQRKSTLEFSIEKEPDESENLQQAELPAVPASEGALGIERDGP